AGADGIAVTFVDWDELARWKMIDTALELGLPEPLETYSSSDHFFEAMHIPVGSSGRMVAAKKIESAPKSDRPARSSASRGKSSSAKSANDKAPAEKAPREKSARVRTRTKRIAD
ncbi:MAG: hypothetical protein RIQ39_1172, partial [Actinomycetota bacterium]